MLNSIAESPDTGRVTADPLASCRRTLSLVAPSTVPTTGLEAGSVSRTREPGASSTESRGVEVCAPTSCTASPARANAITAHVRANSSAKCLNGTMVSPTAGKASCSSVCAAYG